MAKEKEENPRVHPTEGVYLAILEAALKAVKQVTGVFRRIRKAEACVVY